MVERERLTFRQRRIMFRLLNAGLPREQSTI
jgi:hypothetical protein